MNRFLLRSSLFVATLLPLGASAQNLETSGDVLRAMIAGSQGAYDLKYELHANMKEEVYLAAWISGSSKQTDDGQPEADMRITFDAATKEGTMRIRAQVKAKDGKSYVFIDEVSGKVDHELLSATALIQSKKWLMLPMDASEVPSMKPNDILELLHAEGILEMADSVFALRNGGLKNGYTEYSLTLRPEALSMINMQTGGDDLQKAALTMKLTMDGAQTLHGMTLDGALQSEEFSMSIVGEMKRRAAGLNVMPPTDAVDLMNLPGMDSWLLPSIPSDPWDDETGNESHTWPDEDSLQTTEPSYGEVCNSSALRKGLCGQTRPRNRR